MKTTRRHHTEAWARVGRIAALAAGLSLTLGCAAPAPRAPAAGQQVPPQTREHRPAIYGFELLGEAVLSARATVDGAPVGGLSGITYDSMTDLYYAISDDPGSRGPARFYTLDIDLESGPFDASKVRVTAVTELLDAEGLPLREMTFDLESIELSAQRTLFISSEGQVNRGVGPFVREYSLDGSYLRELELPAKFYPTPSREDAEGSEDRSGIRHNLGFESLALADDETLLTASENALHQDGPEADVAITSPARIVRIDRGTGRPAEEFVYQVEPVEQAPLGEADFRTRGLVELLSLGDDRLLALEREYSQGIGNLAEIFSISLDGATDVSRRKSLQDRSFRSVEKTRILPLQVLGLELDNLEGMTLGPRLADGRRTLLLVADNNFNPAQRNQLLAFAIEEREITVQDVQGAGHHSPLEGAWVREVAGTVTSRAARENGFWMQAASDDEEATSDAILVRPAADFEPAPGDVVVVEGLVQESGFPGGLTVTVLESAHVTVVERRAPLPVAVEIGANRQTGASAAAAGADGNYAASARRALPTQIDDDGLEVFDPRTDAIDLFESLEGMRVSIAPASVVGPTSRYREFAVLPDDLIAPNAVRTRRGGLAAVGALETVRPFLVVPRPGGDAPDVAVGDRFEQPITGVLDYAFGTFRVLAEPLPKPVVARRPQVSAALAIPAERLRLATYNVENMSVRSEQAKFERVARTIATALGSPDIVALQEIQDDSGSDDDGTVSSEMTLWWLCETIAAVGGARYKPLAIPPRDGADGGRPGANIRVAFLYREDRVRFVSRGLAETAAAAEWLIDERGPFLSPNPARLDPGHPAFSADAETNRTGSRKPLIAEFDFDGRRLFVVNVHLRSKRGDSPPFGVTQPPVRHTEPLRRAEALAIRASLEQLLAIDANASVVVLGDFNEHPDREPIRTLSEAGLTNLVERVPIDARYTYIYQGLSQVLDNVLVSDALAADPGTTIEIVHSNSDLPSSKRASDHDPILVGLQLTGERP